MRENIYAEIGSFLQGSEGDPLPKANIAPKNDGFQ